MKNFFIKHRIAFLVTITLNFITLIQLLFDIIDRSQFNTLNLFIYFCLVLYFSFTTKAKPNPKIQEWSLRVDDKLADILNTIFNTSIKLIITIFKIILFIFICNVFPGSNIIFLIIKLIILFFVLGWIIMTWDK